MERELGKSLRASGTLEAERRAKAEQTTREANAAIAEEKQARDAKTARLRALRIANEATRKE
jgi:hypothetical protein